MSPIVANSHPVTTACSPERPGFDPTFANFEGASPVGPTDGSQSRFTTDASGAGTLEADVPAGNSTFPPGTNLHAIGRCLLDEYEVHIVSAYHMDGMTCGDQPCADAHIAEQVGFIIKDGAAVSP